MYLVLGVTLMVALHTAWRPQVSSRVAVTLVPSGIADDGDPWLRERRDAGEGGPSTLLDLQDFSFTRLVDKCNHTGPLLWAGMVLSAPGHFYHRRQIRSTWANHRQVVFLLGKANATIQLLIENEAREFGDIVQGNFIDSYRNMTYKHVMGLLWAKKHCSSASFILKTDDDVFVNTAYLDSYLPSLPDQRLIFCPVMTASLVQRSYRSKWRVSPEEYSGRWYPSYCSGWVIVYSPDVVNLLYSQVQKEPYFWIDDVHITGTAAEKLNITHTPILELGLSEYETEKVLEGKPRSDFLFSLTVPKNFQRLWTMVNDVSSNDI